MQTSRPIEVEGRFLGVAVTDAVAAAPWRFIALAPAVEHLDGASFSSPAEATQAARLAALHRRQPATAGDRP